jgi:hypothetical protein
MRYSQSGVLVPYAATFILMHSSRRFTRHRSKHIGNTMENEIKELEPMKAYKYLGVEEIHNIEQCCATFLHSRHTKYC